MKNATNSVEQFEGLGARHSAVEIPLLLVEGREELQPETEQLAGLAGFQIIYGVNGEVITWRVVPHDHLDGTSS